MLCNAFGIVPATALNMHYTKLDQPSIIVPVKTGHGIGKVYKVNIDIPKLYVLDGGFPSFGGFKKNVVKMRRRFKIEPVAYHVTEVMPKIPDHHRYVEAAFLEEADIYELVRLRKLSSTSVTPAQAEAKSRLLSALMRSCFIGNDETRERFTSFYDDDFPMFTIRSAKHIGDFKFDWFKMMPQTFAL